MKSYHGTGLRKSTNRGAVHIFHSRSQLAHSTQDEYYNSFVDRGPPPDRRQINIKLNKAKMTTWPFKKKLALGNMNLGESDLPVDELVKTSLGNSLYKLSLRGNPMAVVPRQLVTNLPSLKHLDLSHCELSELPRIWDLPKLKVLNLSYNHISEFPSEVSCFRFTRSNGIINVILKIHYYLLTYEKGYAGGNSRATGFELV
jgi:hypothetical protein